MIKKLISGTLIGLMMISSVGYVQASGTGETISFPDDQKNELSNMNLFNATAPVSTTSIQHNFGNLTDTIKYDGFVGYGSTKYNLYSTTSRGVVTTDSIEAKTIDNYIEVYSKENYNFVKGNKTPGIFSVKFKANPAGITTGRGQNSTIGLKNITTDKYIINAGLSIWQQSGYNYAQALGENWCNANPAWNSDERKCINSSFTTGKYIHLDFLKNNGKNSAFFYKIPDLTGEHTFDIKFNFESKIITLKILNNQNTEVVNTNISVANIYDFDYSDFSNFKYYARSATTNNTNEKILPISTSLEFTLPPPPSTNIPGLVADYTLNGNANDTSGNGNHGTATNVTYETLPNGNKVAVFNGTNSYLTLNNSIYDISKAFSISMNVEYSNLSNLLNSIVYENGDNLHNGVLFYSNTPNYIGFWMYDRSLSTWKKVNYNVNNGKNYHITGIYDGVNTIKLYIDGKFIGSENIGSVTNTALNHWIGKESTQSYFKGKVSNFKIFNRALTASEINQLYQEGMNYLGIVPPKPSTNIPGLVADYTLNGNANDTSGNGNHGTASNVTYETLPNGNKVAVFNGTNSNINAPNKLTSGDYSITTYANLTVNNKLQEIIVSNGSTTNMQPIAITNEGKLGQWYWIGSSSAHTTQTSLNTGNWYTITSQRKGTTAEIYINGTLISTGTVTNNTYTDNWSIGGQQIYNQYWYNGKLGGLKIFNRALSQTEISQLHSESIPYLGLSTPPTASTSFATTDIKNNQVTYSWTDTSSGTAQESKFVLKNESNQIVADNIVTDATTFTETGLSANTSYQRKICAVNSAGEVCSGLITIKTLLDATPGEKTTLFDFYGLSISIIETTKFFKISFTIGKFKINFSIENTEIL